MFESGHCIVGAITLAAVLGGCTVHPPGEREERAAVMKAGAPFAPRSEARELPPLPPEASPDDLVRYAMLANGDLEQRYWQWRAAVEQVPQDATQTTTLNVALGTTFMRGHTDARGTTLTLGNDPMTDIKLPGKLDAAGRLSLENARAAGLRFRKAQLELRNKVLSGYYDYALTAELIRLEQANAQLLRTTATVVGARNRAGAAGQQDLLKAQNEVDVSANDIANMQAQLPAQRALLNALLSREPDAPISVPTTLPEVRPLTYDDSQLLTMAAERNPELAALAAELRGRRDAIRLARLQYIPDFNLSLGTDLAGVTQSVLGQATLPLLRREALDAAVAQAEANLRATESMRRQTRNDLNAQIIMDISTLRNADRQLDLFEHTILPRIRQVVTVTRLAYESGRTTLLDLLDSQRSLIAIERLVANLRITRAKRLADLDTLTAHRLDLAPE